ncbi:DJ-1/PfpI family protein [uncultured Pseudoteredinibacter sp.]|uniref:DJ-1/PfpI family protein n=1 Tax=uncultured Pseudoteredinibacter sp. TaxID=1641701 RepID=UPI00262EEDEE|nr:DJ-1/PfpI family protein [uncultured Pseudoteredinibacter sp.]
MKILMLIYPGMTPLDFLGPLQVWSQWPNANIQVVWQHKEVVSTDTVAGIMPSHSFEDCFAEPDIVFVPGGGLPTLELMENQVVLKFLQQKAQKASWVCSVCTGSLVLAAAGLLAGKRATTHWAALDALATMGVEVIKERYVIDDGVASGGGVTAGIDFGLAMLDTIAGRDVAEAVQLALEYNPQAPFNSGTPEQARPEIVDAVLNRYLSMTQTA